MKKIAYPLLAISVYSIMSFASAEDAFNLHGSTMTGDWNGSRTEFAEKGIKFDGTIAMDSSYLAEGVMMRTKRQHFRNNSDWVQL